MPKNNRKLFKRNIKNVLLVSILFLLTACNVSSELSESEKYWSKRYQQEDRCEIYFAQQNGAKYNACINSICNLYKEGT